MKLRIYLDVEGQEQVANGKDPWPWHFQIRFGDDKASDGAHFLTEATITLPSRELCVQPVLDMLKAQEQRLQADIAADLRRLAERRENLLALTYVE